MLSNNCERKVQNLLASMSGEQLDEIKPHLLAIKGVFSEEIEEEDEEGKLFQLTQLEILFLHIHFC